MIFISILFSVSFIFVSTINKVISSLKKKQMNNFYDTRVELLTAYESIAYEAIFVNIDHSLFRDMTYGVRTPNGVQERVLDHNVRVCQQNDVQYKFRVRLDGIVGVDDTFDFYVLKYPKGGYFAEHVDTDKSDDKMKHVATVIVIPPSRLCDYGGGTLVLYHANGERQVVMPDLQSFTKVVIKLGTRHEVCGIIYGERIVFKAALMIPYKELTDYLMTRMSFMQGEIASLRLERTRTRRALEGYDDERPRHRLTRDEREWERSNKPSEDGRIRED
jgi:hypothetical protein